MNIIEEKLQIRTYHYRAYLETVLHQHNNYLEWLYSNYIQLVFFKNPIDTISLDYFAPSILGACPLLYFDVIENPDEKDDLHYNLQKTLLNGYYVYLFVDEYYVPNRKSYNIKHFVHDVLIYGFDEKQEKYYLLGYDENLHYNKSEIDFSELKKAYNNNDGINRMFISGVKQKEYRIDKKNIIIFLEDYLYSLDSRKHKEIYLDMKNSAYDNNFYKDRKGKDAVFGIAVYNEIINYLEYCMQHNCKNDHRITYLLYEHKKLMKNRVIYYMNNNIIEKDNNIIELATNATELAKVIMYLSIKSIYKHNKKNTYQNVINKLIELRDNDKMLIKKIIDCLKGNV